MLSLSILHPDSEGFIDAKMEDGKITGANISLRVTDEFIESAIKGEKVIQRFPIELTDDEIMAATDMQLNEGVLTPIGEGRYVKLVDAKTIWEKLTYNAWKSAEPGVLFWDKVESESPTDHYGVKTVSTNPCGSRGCVRAA